MPSKIAFAVVDAQIDCLPNGALGFPGSDRIIVPLVEYAVMAADLVVVSRSLHPPDHFSFKGFGGTDPINRVKGTPGSKIVPAIAALLAKDSYVVTKATKPDEPGYSTFEASTLRPLENLEDILAREKVTHVVVGGYWLEGCVAQTAFDANALGYATAVELLCTQTCSGHDVALATIAKLIHAGIICSGMPNV
jgi:nicotinamidase/pyrazinamidase